MNDFVQNGLRLFQSEIAPFAAGYTGASVALFASKTRDEIEIIKAIIRLDPLDAAEGMPEIEVGKFVAARFRVDNYAEILTGLLDSQQRPVASSLGPLSFDCNHGRSAEMKAFDERGLQSYSRFTTLTVEGTNHTPLHQPSLDWALRALATPFGDVGDLGREYGFGALPGPKAARLEVEAYNVAVIDPTSTVTGNTARIGVRLAMPLDPASIRVGVIVIQDGRAIQRLQISGTDMSFGAAADHPKVLAGYTTLPVPKDALLHCFVSYDGAPLHAHFVHEPNTVPNPLRTALETFDPELNNIRKGLGIKPATAKGTKLQDDLEHAVAALLFMLGFTSYRLGMETMTDAPDLLMRVGNKFALVECTRGTFPGEKRQKLLKRTKEVTERLRHSWLPNPEVLPVIVTSEPRHVALPSIPDARSEGIAVLTADDLRSIVEDMTLLPPNPEALMEQLFRSIESRTSEE